ncbi:MULTISPECIES: hypothetical protein [Halolamina]|uniref:Lipoprotein n=1 Tax=Halolamina pelagica TaxID=699431 RepID=A0A1I5P6U1_9EURY|nr:MULTISPECIES: hypothetical protein [Halolamina]NHX36659.1 hypothetical protein [Halolamina sp. R1-12]SFP29693.1 hypothetical protein SAMN05216277_102381 [Halolamina pelagica]
MRRAVFACVLLVVAGCGGVVAPTPADGGPDEVAVEGELPVDPTPVFERVVSLLDERADPPTVTVETADESSTGPDLPRFWVALGVTPHSAGDPTGPHVRTHGATGVDGESVTVYEWVLDEAGLTESTLAHEFVHVVQFQHGWDEAALRRQPRIDGDLSYDGATTYLLLREGAATYTQTVYERRYLRERQPAMAHQAAAYGNASAYARLLLARYHYGAEYVAARADSPAGLEALHHDPPTSTEQVLHGSDDPVADLTVRVGPTSGWTERDRDRQGELFLRVALRTELNRSAAVDAAHGWGDDRRVTFVRNGEVGTAWVLRWDDAANATEFEAAFERFLDAKATRNGSVWYQDAGSATYRLQRVTNRTTVVYLGERSFVRAANARGERGSGVEIVAKHESAA